MHPLIARARPAQQRARHIIDVALGPLDITAPEVADITARDQLELACRSKAREMLDDDTRTWLAETETRQRDDTIQAAASQLDLTALAATRSRIPAPSPPRRTGSPCRSQRPNSDSPPTTSPTVSRKPAPTALTSRLTCPPRRSPHTSHH